MANRPKTKRNNQILELWDKGWRQQSIANMYKMKVSAVAMVIFRSRHRNNKELGKEEK